MLIIIAHPKDDAAVCGGAATTDAHRNPSQCITGALRNQWATGQSTAYGVYVAPGSGRSTGDGTLLRCANMHALIARISESGAERKLKCTWRMAFCCGGSQKIAPWTRALGVPGRGFIAPPPAATHVRHPRWRARARRTRSLQGSSLGMTLPYYWRTRYSESGTKLPRFQSQSTPGLSDT